MVKPASPVTSTIYCIVQTNHGCTRQCLLVVLLVSIHLEATQILFGHLKWFNQTTAWHKKNGETIVKRVPAKKKMIKNDCVMLVMMTMIIVLVIMIHTQTRSTQKRSTRRFLVFTHTQPFTHKRFYTQELFTQILLHTDVSKRRFLRADFFYTKIFFTGAFLHR